MCEQKQQAIWATFLTAFLVLAVTYGAPATGESASSETFTTTTTHVELNSLGQFFKIEFPELGIKPSPPPISAGKKELGSFYLNFLSLAELDIRSMNEKDQPAFARIGILRVPFISFYALLKGEKMEGGVQGYISENLFALFDFVAERGEERTKLGGQARFVRYTVLDTIVFTLWRTVFTAPQRIEWEAFDLPMITTLRHIQDGNDSYWRVLNVPFLWVYRSSHEEDSTDVHFVDGPGVAIFRHEEKGNDQDKWELFDALLVKGARGKREGDRSHFGVVESFKLFNGPFLALYNSDVERDERGSESQIVTSKQALRLPFLGPLIGTWKDQKGGHFAVLPNVFIKSKNRPEAFQFF